jgi:hypothetical protein
MKPPIIADSRGDVLVFETVALAESYMEPVDVRNGDYVVFDSEGRLLAVAVERKGRHDRTVLRPGEAIPAHASVLRETLLRFLAKTRLAAPGMEQMNLPQLLDLMSGHARKGPAAAVSDGEQTSMKKSFSVVEIDALGYLKAEEQGVAYIESDEYFARFLDFFLREENFSKLVRLKSRTRLFGLIRNRPEVACEVIVSRQDAARSKGELQRRWMEEFSVLFVLNQPLSTVLEYCLTPDHRVTGRAKLDSGEAGDPFAYFPDSAAFESCLARLDVRQGECLAVFAHDAVPMYLMEPA